jgi:hypothetical protein
MDLVLPFPRGRSHYQGQTISSADLPSVHLEGQKHCFRNVDPTNKQGARDDDVVHARIVRNSSAVALTAGFAVTWQALFRNRRVDGYARTTTAEIAGIVDDWIGSGGVQVNDLFYCIYDGQTLVKTPMAGSEFGGDWSEGDFVGALTAATSGATTAGRMARFNAAVTTHLASAILNKVGRVMSAKTTANTNANCLIDVKLA